MLYVVVSHCAFGDGAVLLFLIFSKTKETESLHILAGLFDILLENAFSTIMPIFIGLFDFYL